MEGIDTVPKEKVVARVSAGQYKSTLKKKISGTEEKKLRREKTGGRISSREEETGWSKGKKGFLGL